MANVFVSHVLDFVLDFILILELILKIKLFNEINLIQQLCRVLY